MLLFSPLEHFKIHHLFQHHTILISNFNIFLILTLACLSFISFFLIVNKSFFSVIPSRIQAIFETIYSVIFSLLQDNVGNEGKNFFPFIFTLFIFILSLNLIGLIPYSFAVTSHLIVTFTFALMIFIGINIICINKHGMNMLSLFLPAGSSFLLAILLVPIEIVSYLFRPISLSVRLFANIMAGHTLLKVIAGFAWTMLVLGNKFLMIGHALPLAVLIILMVLELGVAVIQSYVFTILTCIYLCDAVHLH